jgi:hypothetical protein
MLIFDIASARAEIAINTIPMTAQPQPAQAVSAHVHSSSTATSTFEELDAVANNVGQEFYRGWKLRISGLKTNYQQINRQSGDSGLIVYLANGTKTECPSTAIHKAGEAIAQIAYTSQRSEMGLKEKFDFYGCDGTISASEILIRTGKALVPLTSVEISQGVRRFSRAENETRFLWTLEVPSIGRLITVDSFATPTGTATNFFLQSNLYMASQVTRLPSGEKILRYDIYPYGFKIRFKNLGTWYSNDDDRETYQVIQSGGDSHYKLNLKLTYSSEYEFEKSFSDHVTSAQQNTGGLIFTALLKEMPVIAIEAPSAGANQRILNELNLAINRVTTKSQLDLVRNLLQSYVNSLNKGEIVIEDKRPN